MPDVSAYPVTSAGNVQDLPCGKASMEVRNRDIVVWKLDGKTLGIVFTRPNDFIGLWDPDFDRRVDYITVAPAGSGTVTDDYRRVRGCEGI